MLSFYYDVIDKYISRDDFNIVEMDTDSLYMAISADTIEEVVKPDLLSEWVASKHKWFPRTDTEENIQFDKRTPGLFKVEWSGDAFIGLNSKSYYCHNHDGKDKYSSKGISRTIPLSMEDYLNVLDKKSIPSQTNKGFIFRDNKMLSYDVRKDGLTHKYFKRKVLSDGCSTTFLDI